MAAKHWGLYREHLTKRGYTRLEYYYTLFFRIIKISLLLRVATENEARKKIGRLRKRARLRPLALSLTRTRVPASRPAKRRSARSVGPLELSTVLR